jgi:hypothetical protein
MLQRRDLVSWDVAAVVDDDVERAVGGRQLGEERRVALISDGEMHVPPPQVEDALVDVDADDRRAAAEPLAHHVERAAVGHADLEDGGRLPAEATEMALVDREVVVPLVGETALVALEDVGQRAVPGHAVAQSTNRAA